MTSGKLTKSELERAMEYLKRPRGINIPFVFFPVPELGHPKRQLKFFLEYGGADYFYYPGKGYYDRQGNLHKEIRKVQEVEVK